MKLRVWWVPQIPMEAFYVEVESPLEGAKLLHILAMYDLFQFENKVKPDYCNIGGLEEFDPEDKTDGPDGSWTDWYDEEGRDIEEYLEDFDVSNIVLETK